MSIRTLLTLSLIALQAFNAIANPLTSSTEHLNDAEELVFTPAGLVPKANVHAVPEGARVHQTSTEVHIIGSDGSIIHSAPISREASTKPRISNDANGIAPRALSSGYVAYSYWKNTAASNISSFSTSWIVPPTPTQKDGQLLYIFNALVPSSDFSAIFQPVLQFGVSPAGGGNYWAVASWYLIGVNTYYTPITQVNAAQTITGVMSLKSTTTSGTTKSYSWNSIFTGFPSSSLTISTTEVFNYCYEALEIYTTTSDSDLPTGGTMMSNITIVTQDGSHPQAPLNWTTVSDSTDGFKMAVVSGASPNGALQISYP